MAASFCLLFKLCPKLRRRHQRHFSAKKVNAKDKWGNFNHVHVAAHAQEKYEKENPNRVLDVKRLKFKSRKNELFTSKNLAVRSL